MAEAERHRRFMKLATKLGARLFRNNVGQGWTGKRIQGGAGSLVVLQDARPFHAGLCVGSSDLIGWTPVTITPDMVGQTIAVFTAVEVKEPVRPRVTTEQAAFIHTIAQAGGYSGVAITDEDVSRILRRG